MIRDARHLSDGAVVEADVGVVGAGLAGIDIARFLVQHGMRVVLLESGRLEFDSAIQELAQVTCVGKTLRTRETHAELNRYLPPMYRGYCRIRQFGGTSNVWTGKWRIFDPLDFEQCPWIPYSGWPITLDDLLPFYREIASDYGFGDFEAEERGDLFRCVSRLLAPHNLEPHLFYWETTTTRSGARFFHELKQAPGLDVVLGATATELVLHDDLRTVQAVRIKTFDQKCFTLRADRFVLSTGGLEVPRLLLTSNRQIAEGIGNAHGLVGRFFMDHPKHVAGAFKPGRAIKQLIQGLETQPRPRFAMSFTHTAAFQRAHSLPNHFVSVHPVRSSLGFRRNFKVTFAIAQEPNPESRVYLGSERDALGIPRLVVDWRFKAADHRAVAVLQETLRASLLSAQVGRLEFGSTPVTLDTMIDAAHHMGTTRMAADQAHGVVDGDCRVFGTTNLYVASSSVFITSHANSPTYTILAIARRLARHLWKRHAAARPPVVDTSGTGEIA